MSKVWFVTGSSRGLGRVIVETALKSGARVIATARKPEQLHSLVEQYGERIFPVALDVSKYENALEAVKAGHEKFGRIDVVVNNAGYANLTSFEDLQIDDFQAQIDTNFYGVVYVCKAVVPILRSQGSGHIFQISSLGGRMTTAGLSAYQAAKHAVGGFSGVLAKELKPLGVKVITLEPGGMATDWSGSSMTIPPVSEPYKQTVGYWVDLLRVMRENGVEDSKLVKVAGVILKLLDVEDPPEKLLLGPQSVEYGQSYARELLESDKKWEELSRSTF